MRKEDFMLKEIPVKFNSGFSFSLRFTMDIWARIENEICMIGDIGEKISSGKGRLQTAVKIAAIMTGDEKIAAATIWGEMEPRDLRTLNNAITQAITENLAMETEKEDEDAVHDVLLEEIEAKKETAG